MATILQTTFSSAFPWIKTFDFQLQFHRNKYLGSNCQYSNIGSDSGLALNRRQAIIWTNDGLGY